MMEEDWLWSVGDSPLSITSNKAHFSAFERDMAHRHTVVLRAQVSLHETHFKKFKVFHQVTGKLKVNMFLSFLYSKNML